MSISDHVDAIVALMADAEALAEQAKGKLDAVPDHLKAINEDPENVNVGLLISKAFGLRAKALGLDFKAGVWSLHSDMTEAAKARGIDVPGIESGGGR